MKRSKKIFREEEARLKSLHQKLPVRCAMMNFDLILDSKKCMSFSVDISFAMAVLVRISNLSLKRVKLPGYDACRLDVKRYTQLRKSSSFVHLKRRSFI